MSKPQHLVVVLAMEQKTVLVCVGLSRRPISFSSEDGVSDAEKLRGRILESFSDVINDGNLLLIQVSILVFYRAGCISYSSEIRCQHVIPAKTSFIKSSQV